MIFRRLGRITIVIAVLMLMLAGSVALPASTYERASIYARAYGFDFVRWTLGALAIKLEQAVLNIESYLPPEIHSDIVLEYLDLQKQIYQKGYELNEIYVNPDIADPMAASAELRETLDGLYDYRSRLQPLAEQVLQQQVSQVATSEGLGLGGQAQLAKVRLALALGAEPVRLRHEAVAKRHFSRVAAPRRPSLDRAADLPAREVALDQEDRELPRFAGPGEDTVKKSATGAAVTQVFWPSRT